MNRGEMYWVDFNPIKQEIQWSFLTIDEMLRLILP